MVYIQGCTVVSWCLIVLTVTQLNVEAEHEELKKKKTFVILPRQETKQELLTFYATVQLQNTWITSVQVNPQRSRYNVCLCLSSKLSALFGDQV